MTFFNGWTEEQLDLLLNDISVGRTSVFTLPEELYNSTLSILIPTVFEGFGGSISSFDIDSLKRETIASINNNIHVFSGAKTFQQVKDMSNALFDEEGFIRAFRDFKEDATKIFSNYNNNWLRAERATANNMALGARHWVDTISDADIAPFLTYQTVGDERVRPEHIRLDGITRKVNDSFWNNFYPPNGWRCRCTVNEILQEENAEITPSGDLPNPKSLEPLFRMNPGKDKIIFHEDKHPYFKVEERFDILKRNNFNLPVHGTEVEF